MSMTPTLAEADAFWQIKPEHRKVFAQYGRSWHGWVKVDGRWVVKAQQSHESGPSDFLPSSAFDIIEATVMTLRDSGLAPYTASMTRVGLGQYVLTIRTRNSNAITASGVSPVHCALHGFSEAMKHIDGVELDTGPTLLGQHKGQGDLK